MTTWPNSAASGNARSALLFAVARHAPGVPEPRSFGVVRRPFHTHVPELVTADRTWTSQAAVPMANQRLHEGKVLALKLKACGRGRSLRLFHVEHDG